MNIPPFTQRLFDEQTIAAKAAEIEQAILAGCSLRLTEIAAKMQSRDASYRRTSGFSQQADPATGNRPQSDVYSSPHSVQKSKKCC